MAEDPNDELLREKEPPPPIGMAMAMPAVRAPMAPPVAPAIAPSNAPGPAMPISQPAQPQRPAFALPEQKKPLADTLWAKSAGIQNPFERILARTGIGLGKALDVAGSSIFPGIAMNVPGSTANANLQNNRANKQAIETETLNQKPELAEAAGAEKERLRKEQDDAAQQRTETQQAGASARNANTVTGEDTRSAAGIQGRADLQANKPGTFEEQAYDEYKQAHPGATRLDYEKAKTAATEKPEKEPRQLMEVPQADGSTKIVEAKPGMTIPAGATKVGAPAGKPTADEQRRADLAQNLNHNLDLITDIATRRPELFGPLAGRWTALKEKFGTDDPDIAALMTAEHQIGMAQISAHGMRSAQGIEGAAQSIMNGLHNSANATIAAADTARNSVKTFTEDVENPEFKTHPGGSQAAPKGKVLVEGKDF